MLEEENEKIILIEYKDNNKIHSVVTESGYTFDVDYSKRDDTYYYRLSGRGSTKTFSNISGKVWCLYPDRITNNHDCTVIKDILHKKHDGSNVITMEDLIYACSFEEGRTLYCYICNDSICTDYNCDHFKWSNEWGDFVGCGVHYFESEYEDISRLVISWVDDMNLKDQLIESLGGGDFLETYEGLKIGKRLIEKPCYNNENDFAYLWLSSLCGENTDEYIKKTIGWLIKENRNS